MRAIYFLPYFSCSVNVLSKVSFVSNQDLSCVLACVSLCDYMLLPGASGVLHGMQLGQRFSNMFRVSLMLGGVHLYVQLCEGQREVYNGVMFRVFADGSQGGCQQRHGQASGTNFCSHMMQTESTTLISKHTLL